MKVIFIAQRLEKPSTRFRVLQYLPYLRQNGVDVTLKTVPESLLGRWRLFQSLDAYDVVFVQKKLFGRMELAYLRRKARKMVYDLDDAVMFKSSGSCKETSVGRNVRFRRTVECADLVIAGNQYLREQAESFGSKVAVIPTPIDTERYFVSDRSAEDIPTVGWSGSTSTNYYINRLLPVLNSVKADFRFKIISNDLSGIDLERFSHTEVSFVEWSEETEVEELQTLDIGLMPLEDDVWARGKCGLKALQYMALGIATICSPVGVNREIVADGENGFLVVSDEEWVEKLTLLIEDAELRKKLGSKGRLTTEQRYSFQVNAPKLLVLLRETCAGDC